MGVCVSRDLKCKLWAVAHCEVYTTDRLHGVQTKV